MWSSRPGTGVLTASALDITAAAALALTGILMDAVTPAVALTTITVVLAAAALIDLFKVSTFRTLGIHQT